MTLVRLYGAFSFFGIQQEVALDQNVCFAWSLGHKWLQQVAACSKLSAMSSMRALKPMRTPELEAADRNRANTKP